MGPTLNPDVISQSMALMKPLQAPRTGLSVSKDIAYGPDPLQKMDLYPPQESAAAAAPTVIYVHGGGFARGDKQGGENIAAYFARHGLLGVTVNYRLAPTVQWPEQSLDLGSAVAWLKANAAKYGGDPRRIVVIGHSSGAAVAASYVLDTSIKTDRDGVVGAVLLSGVFGYGTSAPAYYGGEAGTTTCPKSGVSTPRTTGSAGRSSTLFSRSQNNALGRSRAAGQLGRVQPRTGLP
jgi:triacylglycerol lipase